MRRTQWDTKDTKSVFQKNYDYLRLPKLKMLKIIFTNAPVGHCGTSDGDRESKIN
jgi:hypothetical protein